jgi:hypothetical protein
MSKAFIIEVESRTAGIVTKDERGYRFFSAERVFESMDGRQFRSARHAERAARALLQERIRANPLFVSAFWSRSRRRLQRSGAVLTRNVSGGR